MLARMFAGACALIASSVSSWGQCAQWDQGFHVGFSGPPLAACVFDDGSGPALYAAGNFTSAGATPALDIARWDGTSWSPLGVPGNGMNGNGVLALASFDDGSGPALYAGGEFTTAGGVIAQGIAKWNGTSWSAVGAPSGGVSGSSPGVYALGAFDDGSGPALYAGGLFTSAGGVPAVNIAKWNGTSWSAVGAPSSGMNGWVLSLTTFDDGSGPALYAGGNFTSAGGVSALGIAKWNGTSWSAVGSGMSNNVWALTTFDDGSGAALYAGGDFTVAGGVSAQRVAKWDGTSWSALGAAGGGTNDTVRVLTTFDDGSGPALYAGGFFTSAGGISAPLLAKWNGTSWSALGGGVLASPWVPGVLTLTTFDDGSGPALYAGGTFMVAGGVSANRFAKWSGASWSAVGTAGGGIEDQVVSCLATSDDGSGPALYAGGGFSSASGFHAQGIAKWSGTSWSPLGAPGSQLNGRVFALTTFDDGAGPALYAGGDFTSAGGVSALRIAKWNGTSWSTLGAPGSGMNGGVRSLAVFDDGSGPALYAGGGFTTADNVPTPYIARWNGTSWSTLGAPGSGMNGGVNSLAVFDDGAGPTLFAGGWFTTAGGVSALRIAKWNGTSWSAVGAPGGGISGTSNVEVDALGQFDDGSGPALYAGGFFTSAGGVSAINIAKWNGLSWSAMGAPGSGTNGSVVALTAFDDGSGTALYAGGSFTSAGGVAALNIAKWNGTSWSAVGAPGSGMNSTVFAMTIFDDGSDGDADLYLGGSFTTAGGTPSVRIAEWHGCANMPFAYCFGDASSGACPCSNAGATGHGCDNSVGNGGAQLTSSGTISPDTLVLHQTNELASSFSIFLQGSAKLATPASFGDGLRCIGGTLRRLYLKSASGGDVSAPLAGDPSISARSSALGDPLSPGDVRHYQVYYRDPSLTFCPAPQGNTFNVGNALRVTW